MTVRPPSVPPIAPHIDEREIEREDDNTPVDEISSSREGWSRDIERGDDISSDVTTSVDETSSSRDSLPRDIERGDDIPSDVNTPVDETSSSRDGLSGDIERE